MATNLLDNGKGNDYYDSGCMYSSICLATSRFFRLVCKSVGQQTNACAQLTCFVSSSFSFWTVLTVSIWKMVKKSILIHNRLGVFCAHWDTRHYVLNDKHFPVVSKYFFSSVFWLVFTCSLHPNLKFLRSGLFFFFRKWPLPWNSALLKVQEEFGFAVCKSRAVCFYLLPPVNGSCKSNLCTAKPISLVLCFTHFLGLGNIAK